MWHPVVISPHFLWGFQKACCENCNYLRRMIQLITRLISVTFLRTVRLLVLSYVVWTAYAWAEFGPAIDTLMDAESRLSTGNPFLTVPRQALAIFNRRFSNYADIPAEYLPVSGKIHELTVLLIPEEDLPPLSLSNELDKETRNILYKKGEDGRTYVRFFIHPNPIMQEYYKEEIAKYPRDTTKWEGQLQSSGRTLTVRDPSAEHPHIMIKASLDKMMGTGTRILINQNIPRSPSINDAVAEIHAAERAKPDGLRFTYFPDVAGIPGMDDKGGYSIRIIPKEIREGKLTGIPLYALINSKREPLWIDELAAAMGKTRQEFVVDLLVPELVDVYSKLAFENGLIPELHQQNTLVMFDPENKQFKGLGVRDLDFKVDPVLRARRGLPPLPNDRFPMIYTTAHNDRIGMHKGYNLFIRLESLAALFGASGLSGINTFKIVAAADRRLLENANRIYGKGTFIRISQLHDFHRRTERSAPPVDLRDYARFAHRDKELREAFTHAQKQKKDEALNDSELEYARFVVRDGFILAVDAADRLIGMVPAGKSGREVHPNDHKVTVVIPVYNGAETILSAVRSVLEQTHTNLEILIVDDASTDNTWEILKENVKDPRIKMVRLKENIGLYSLKNFALKNLTEGEFVTWHDADDVSHPKRIERQLELALRYDLDAVGVSFVRSDGQGGETILYQGVSHANEPCPLCSILEHPRTTSRAIISEGQALYRTSSALAIGGFEGRWRFGGDVDFATRFMRMFPYGAYTQEPMYFWLPRPGSLTMARGTHFLSLPRIARNLWRYGVKFKSNVQYWLRDQEGFMKAVQQDLYYPETTEITETYRPPGSVGLDDAHSIPSRGRCALLMALISSSKNGR